MPKLPVRTVITETVIEIDVTTTDGKVATLQLSVPVARDLMIDLNRLLRKLDGLA